MLYDIMIYDHTGDKGNTILTVADSGTMKITKDKKYMILNLFSGETHAEMQPRDRQKATFPSRTDKFEKQSLVTVLQGMELERKNESVFRNQNRALRNSQIVYVADSLGKTLDKLRTDNALMLSYISPLNIGVINLARKDTTRPPPMKLIHYSDVDSIMKKSTAMERVNIISSSLNSARNNARAIQQSDEMVTASVRILNRFGIEWHKKYTFAIACLIFVLIGAPLGAIIRKGGLGMPLVISIMLFIFYWIISTTGEKTSRESVSSIWQGVWFSTLIFLPMGLLLTYKAANDSVVFNVNAFTDFFKKIFKKFKKEDKDKQDKLLQ
jgi:lipopolysaccharide export system permease protein